ncbi:hypothetical protein P9112_006243 [Eukaryota sp. TZLM1-RC]
MFNLGYCYDHGLGVEMDYQQAFHWCSKASEAGNSSAMCSLGTFNKFFIGSIRQPGDRIAMFNSGNRYEHCKGVPKDLHQAIEWYEKAKDAGDEDAAERIEVSNRKLTRRSKSRRL